MSNCPGQDLGRKRADEVVSYLPCPKCKTEIEFWYDETKRKCPNPECNYLTEKSLAQILKDYGCALWCNTIESCLGKSASEKIEDFKRNLR